MNFLSRGAELKVEGSAARVFARLTTRLLRRPDEKCTRRWTLQAHFSSCGHCRMTANEAARRRETNGERGVAS